MKNTIDAFISDKHVAIIGASRSREKWGNMVVRALKKRGYSVYPVNPNADEIDGERCYHSVQELPSAVAGAIVTIPKDAARELADTLNDTKLKRIWFHDGAGGDGTSSPQAIETCRKNGIDVVYGVCPMMFFPKAGIHKLHLWFKKIGGNLPQELVETLQ